ASRTWRLNLPPPTPGGSIFPPPAPGGSLLALRTVEEPTEPRIALALGDRLELVASDPQSVAGGALFHLDPVLVDGGEALAALGAAHTGRFASLVRMGGRALPAELLERRLVALGVEAILLRLLLLAELLAEPVLVVIPHSLSPSRAGTWHVPSPAAAGPIRTPRSARSARRA